MKEYALRTIARANRRIGVTSDCKVWYVDYTRAIWARLDPQPRSRRVVNPSGPQSMPYAMTVDDRDRIWYV